MRTFGIVVGTIFAFLVVGIGGYLLGWGVLWKSDAIFAEVNANGDLEITSRHAGDVEIKSVTFNDYGMVFRYGPGGYAILHAFNGTDGAYPTPLLAQGTDGRRAP